MKVNIRARYKDIDTTLKTPFISPKKYNSNTLKHA